MPDGPYGNKRVLIADDETLVAETLHDIIRNRLACGVDAVNDGDAALDALAARRYDVLLTDMIMPGVHGVEIVQRAASKWPHLDIIVMTGFPAEFPYVDVVRAGAGDFIQKPCFAAELEAKLVRVFGEQKLREDLEREKDRIQSDMERMQRMRSAQQVAEAKYRTLFELAMNGMLIVEPEELRITEANRAFCELSGQEWKEIANRPFPELLAPPDASRFGQGLEFTAQSGRGTLADMHLVLPNGEDTPIDINVTFMTVETQRFILLACYDISSQREVQQKLAEAANTDAMTGLYNQGRFHARVNWAVTDALRRGRPLSLMFIDLDNFKRCNDTHGHPTGDALLRDVSRVLTSCSRSVDDEGFRLGGDEFALLLRGAELGVADRVATRVRDAFSQVERYGTTMSIGLAQLAEGMDADALTAAADEALYKAKASGKDTIRRSGD